MGDRKRKRKKEKVNPDQVPDFYGFSGKSVAFVNQTSRREGILKGNKTELSSVPSAQSFPTLFPAVSLQGRTQMHLG